MNLIRWNDNYRDLVYTFIDIIISTINIWVLCNDTIMSKYLEQFILLSSKEHGTLYEYTLCFSLT